MSVLNFFFFCFVVNFSKYLQYEESYVLGKEGIFDEDAGDISRFNKTNN